MCDLHKILSDGSARKAQVFDALYKVSLLISKFSDEEVDNAITVLEPHLNKKGGDECFRVYAVGHAHLDLAWLWPIRETKRKAARTFSTAIELLDKYPDYIFGASQPQAYQWSKECTPAFTQIKKGRGEDGISGRMWLKPIPTLPAVNR